jgi:hypothetical protein
MTPADWRGPKSRIAGRASPRLASPRQQNRGQLHRDRTSSERDFGTVHTRATVYLPGTCPTDRQGPRSRARPLST